MWLLESDWCIIPLRMNEKKNIQVNNEWMNEKWSDVLMSRTKIYGPTGMDFGVW